MGLGCSSVQVGDCYQGPCMLPAPSSPQLPPGLPILTRCLHDVECSSSEPRRTSPLPQLGVAQINLCVQFADNAFAGVTVLKTAHLENNRLTQLPRNFPFDKMETLTLSRNAWHCNCQLAHLRKYGPITPSFPSFLGLLSGSPSLRVAGDGRRQCSARRVCAAAALLPVGCASCKRLRSPPRWLKGNRTRTEDTCSTPAQYRGQSIRDTPALRTCKLPTKRSRKGSRH